MTSAAAQDNPPQEGPDAGRWIKTAVCALFFVAAAGYFAFVSRGLLDNYFIAMAPTKELSGPWLIRIGIAAFLLLLMFGVMAVLVRPPLIAAAACVAGMAVYAFILGGDPAAWYAAGGASVLLLALMYSVTHELENQVDFSVRVLGDKELRLCSILAVLLAVAVGLGYVRDSARLNYVVPPQVTSWAKKQASVYVANLLDSQHLSGAQRKLVQQASEEQMGSWIDDMEKKAEPYKDYVPFVLGAMAYFTFQLLLFVPGAAAAAVLGPVFSLLTLIGFAGRTKQERIVYRLTLERAPEETKPIGEDGRPSEGAT